MAKSHDEIIADEKRKIEQAKARIQENAKERKLDTRRKVILGGLLLDAARKDEHFNHIVNDLLKRITREHDKNIFLKINNKK